MENSVKKKTIIKGCTDEMLARVKGLGADYGTYAPGSTHPSPSFLYTNFPCSAWISYFT